MKVGNRLFHLMCLEIIFATYAIVKQEEHQSSYRPIAPFHTTHAIVNNNQQSTIWFPLKTANHTLKNMMYI